MHVVNHMLALEQMVYAAEFIISLESIEALTTEGVHVSFDLQMRLGRNVRNLPTINQFNQSINLHFLSLGLIRGVNRQ